ncbi:MAG: SDR family oxidoreductase [Gammaproteobacteria bacterium]|nr:SDR family oxidoreductase [Gammaproteobacteria bacterium]
MGRLDGKIALITGTGGGQGRDAALLFAKEGAKIVGCDLKVEGAAETVEMVKAAGGEMVSMAPLNLSDEAEVKKLIDFAVETYGGFDILYNNASGCRFGPVTELSREDWDFTLDNELTLIFLAVKHGAPVLEKRGGGVIINTASVAGMTGAGAMPGNVPGGLAHAVTKAGVIAMTRVLACELSPQNIRVNSIAPGLILTPGLEPLVGDPESPFRKGYMNAQLIKRVGLGEDIAHCALYLSSDDASYVTGANFVVDGGLSAAGGAGRAEVPTNTDAISSLSFN